MNLIYLSIVFIINFLNLPSVLSAKDKFTHSDEMVNGNCIHFENIEKYCREEAELKYVANNKPCCILLSEIECIKPFAEKVCAQFSFLDKAAKKVLLEKIERKNQECPGFTDCLEEAINIWIIIIVIFTVLIAVCAFCILFVNNFI